MDPRKPPYALLELTSIIDMGQVMPIESLLATLRYAQKKGLLASTGYRVDDKELNDPFITIPRFTTDHIYFENSAFFSDSLRLMVQELHDAGVLGDQSKDRTKRVRQNEIVARYHGISGRLGRHSDYKKDFESRFDKQNSKVIWQMLKFIAEHSHVDEEGKVQLAMYESQLHERFQKRALSNLFAMMGHETPFAKEAYITLEDVQDVDRSNYEYRDYGAVKVRMEDENLLGRRTTKGLKRDLTKENIYFQKKEVNRKRYTAEQVDAFERAYPKKKKYDIVTFEEKLRAGLISEPKFRELAKARRLTMQDCFDLQLLPENEMALIARHFGFKLKGSAGKEAIKEEDLVPNWRDVMNQLHLAKGKEENYLYHVLDSKFDKRAQIDRWFEEAIEKLKSGKLRVKDAVVLGIASPEVAHNVFKDTLMQQGFFDYHLTFERAEKLMKIAPRLGDMANYIEKLTDYRALSARRAQHFAHQIKRKSFPDRVERAFSSAMATGFISLEEIVITCEKMGALTRRHDEEQKRTEFVSGDEKIIISLSDKLLEKGRWDKADILVKALPARNGQVDRQTETIELRDHKYSLSSRLHSLQSLRSVIDFNETTQRRDSGLIALAKRYDADGYLTAKYDSLCEHMRSRHNKYTPLISSRQSPYSVPPTDRRYTLLFESLIASAFVDDRASQNKPVEFMETFIETVDELGTKTPIGSAMSAGEIKLSQLLYSNFLRFDRKLKTALREDGRMQKPFHNYSSALIRLVKPDRWNLGEISLFEAGQNLALQKLKEIQLLDKKQQEILRNNPRNMISLVFNTDNELNQAMKDGELQDFMIRNLSDYKTQLREIENTGKKISKLRDSLKEKAGIKFKPMKEVKSSVFNRIEPNNMLDAVCALLYLQTRDEALHNLDTKEPKSQKSAQRVATHAVAEAYTHYASMMVDNAMHLIVKGKPKKKYGDMTINTRVRTVQKKLEEFGIVNAQELLPEEEVGQYFDGANKTVKDADAVRQYFEEKLVDPIRNNLTERAIAQAQLLEKELVKIRVLSAQGQGVRNKPSLFYDLITKTVGRSYGEDRSANIVK